MININLFIAYIMASIIIILIPGPSATLTLANGINVGFPKTFSLIFGIILADTVLIILAGCGVATVVTSFPDFFYYLKLGAAGYLAYLGVKSFLNLKKENQQNVNQNKVLPAIHSKKLFIQGFLVAITNPATITFFAAFFPLYIDPEIDVTSQLIILSITFLSMATFTLYCYGYFGNKIKSFLVKESCRKAQHIIMGSLLLVMSVCMVVTR